MQGGLRSFAGVVDKGKFNQKEVESECEKFNGSNKACCA